MGLLVRLRTCREPGQLMQVSMPRRAFMPSDYDDVGAAEEVDSMQSAQLDDKLWT